MDKAKKLLRATLSEDAHLSINKALAHKVGLNAAALLADLISKEKYFDERDELKEGSWFFNTQDNIEKDTALTSYYQRKSLKELKKKGFVKVKKMGVPAKNYFKLFHNKILKALTTCDERVPQQEVGNTDDSSNKNNSNNNKNNKEIGASSSEFSLKDKLKEMSTDQRHIQIIGIWMKKRGLQPQNEEQYQKIIKRHLRPAKRLEGYSDEDIRKTIDYVNKIDHIDKPSLETVEKYIDDLIAGNLKGRKPKTWEY